MVAFFLKAEAQLLEFKAGYFFFYDSTMRKIYDNDGIDIQLCSCYPVWKLNNQWSFNIYGAVEYFHKSGKSLNGNEKTSIWALPINLGIRPSYAIADYLHYYFAIGPRYFHVHQYNDSPYVDKNKSRNGIGFFVNTGINYILFQHLVIDAFGEYSYATTHFHESHSYVYTKQAQLGGLTFGGGIGYAF